MKKKKMKKIMRRLAKEAADAVLKRKDAEKEDVSKVREYNSVVDECIVIDGKKIGAVPLSIWVARRTDVRVYMLNSY